MLRTNAEQLARIAVQGKVAPALRWNAFEHDAEGRLHCVPGVGGITYNVKVGDPAFGWAGDHLEPAVSLVLDESKRGDKANIAFNFLACCGNEAVLVSGDAKGAIGVVTGHHGGVEHVMVDFPDATLDRMTLDDRVLIRGFGQGLRLADFPDIHCYNIDPALLARWGVRDAGGGTLAVPVTALVPGALMGSGLGYADPATGDYDITTMDKALVRRHRLDAMRLGDFVALLDSDNVYGRHFRTGAVTIGIVVHSDSNISGHGPGVATLLTAARPLIRPVIDPAANIGRLLGIGRYRRGAARALRAGAPSRSRAAGRRRVSRS
jgi:hypothetical protein